MIKSKEEILTLLKDRIGEDTSDEAIGFIEDVTDTFNDLEEKGKGQENWKEKYEENDKAWRQKYRDRFYSSVPDEPDPEEPDEKPAKHRYEDLFKMEV